MPGRRGFASMKPEQVRTIASQGGKAAHRAERKPHEWNPETARAAGRKGGQASAAARRAKRQP